ncbi:hypothetical protein [Streptomyces sp. NPDC059262]|uniref:hypothetical protein n=1 Tax=Streptomyces sp. NPDC059262 TaxID=3346797 RepID=UPI0036A5AA0B
MRGADGRMAGRAIGAPHGDTPRRKRRCRRGGGHVGRVNSKALPLEWLTDAPWCPQSPDRGRLFGCRSAQADQAVYEAVLHFREAANQNRFAKLKAPISQQLTEIDTTSLIERADQ